MASKQDSTIPPTMLTKATDIYVPKFKDKVLKFIRDECNAVPSSSTKSKLIADDCCIPPRKKRKITMISAAKKFCVHPNTVSDWVHTEERQAKIRRLLERQLDDQQLDDTCTSSEFTGSASLDESVMKWLSDFKTKITQSTDINSTNFETSDLSRGINRLLEEASSSMTSDTVPSPSSTGNDLGKSIMGSWVALWAKRLHASPYNDNRDTSFAARIDTIPMAKLIKYPENFKTEIVKFSNALGQRRTSRLFAVSQRRIFEWSKQVSSNLNGPGVKFATSVQPKSAISSTHSKLEILTAPRFSANSSKQLLDIDVEMAVHDWVVSRFPMKPTSKEIRTKAIELYRAKSFGSIKCSYGWYRRWAARFSNTSNFYQDADPVVVSWILEKFDNNEELTMSELQCKAQSLICPMRASFVASAHWARRFIKRNYILLNWEGRFEGCLPAKLEISAQNFKIEAKEAVSKYGFGRKSILCFDEIPITFSSPPASGQTQSVQETLTSRSRSGLRRASIKDCEATILVAILADGTLLPPTVIVKAENTEDLDHSYNYTTVDNEIAVFYGSSTLPSTKCLSTWFDLVWKKYRNLQQPSENNFNEYTALLFWDAFQHHYEPEVEGKCKELKILDMKFPTGTAAKLQPINAFFRINFLNKMDEAWSSYLTRNASKSKIILPSTDVIVNWVSSAYLSLKHSKIQLEKAFDTLLELQL